MYVSLDELSEILEQNKKWRTIGGVKENTRLSTITKIVYALAKEPLTKEAIHRATHVHKGKDTLPKALEIVKHYSIIYEHKCSFKVISLDNPLQTKAYGYTYYLLNWSNPQVKNFFEVARDHAVGDSWSGWYYSKPTRTYGKEIEDLREKLFPESEVNRKEHLQKLATFDPRTFDQIGQDAIALINKRKREIDKEWEGTKVPSNPNTMQRIVLDIFIHFKIQGIYPVNRYPDDSVFYTYVDLWQALDKEDLVNFAKSTEHQAENPKL